MNQKPNNKFQIYLVSIVMGIEKIRDTALIV
jgi:hypothetical protein